MHTNEKAHVWLQWSNYCGGYSHSDLSLGGVVGVLQPIVPDGVAAQDIDGGDEHEHACIEYGEMSPLASDVGQHSSFARIAVETQFVLSVAPCPAISVVR